LNVTQGSGLSQFAFILLISVWRWQSTNR